jgi:precorrin-3B synthase
MDGVTQLRKGFCPGLWTPMASGDGLIVRVRAASRPMLCSELRAIVQLARAHGNGQVELTRRANLQLRGVRSESVPLLQRELLRLGLAEATSDLEQRLQLLVNPLAEVDRACTGLASLGREVERDLRMGEPLPGLHSKFGIVLDAANDAASDVFADVRLELDAGLDHVHVGVAGDRASATWLGGCYANDARAVVWRLVRAWAQRGEPDRQRTQAWLKAGGVDELKAELRAWLEPETPPRPRQVPSVSLLGAKQDWFGIGIPFGACESEVWLQLIELADRFGGGEVRVTPRRSLMLLGVRAEHHARFHDAAKGLGLIVDDADLLRNVEACSGAPACASAFGDTRQLARSLSDTLAPALRGGATLHVSGCAKGCASSKPARITVVRSADGARVAFDADATQAALSPQVKLDVLRVELSAWARRPERSRT